MILYFRLCSRFDDMVYIRHALLDESAETLGRIYAALLSHHLYVTQDPSRRVLAVAVLEQGTEETARSVTKTCSYFWCQEGLDKDVQDKFWRFIRHSFQRGCPKPVDIVRK